MHSICVAHIPQHTYGDQRTARLVLFFYLHMGCRYLIQLGTWQAPLPAESSHRSLPLLLLSMTISHTIITAFQGYQCVCEHACACTGMCAYMCACVCGGQSYHSSDTVYFVFLRLGLSLTWTLPSRPGWPRNLRDPSVSFSQAFDYKTPSCLACVCVCVSGEGVDVRIRTQALVVVWHKLYQLSHLLSPWYYNF